MSRISIFVPSSKSYTQRALILSALTDGATIIKNPLDCDDSFHLRNCLRRLGAEVDDVNPNQWLIGQIPLAGSENNPSSKTIDLWCENGGTVLRFLAPLVMLIDQEIILDGNDRLKQRPLHSIIQAMDSIGIVVSFPGKENCLPLKLHRKKFSDDSRFFSTPIELDPRLTSQLLSGFLMVCPLLSNTSILRLTNKPVSKPYVQMTIEMMQLFGYDKIHILDDLTISVNPGTYSRETISIEKDWSSAATILTAQWLTDCLIHIDGLNNKSIQGDRQITQFLQTLKNASKKECNHFDITDCPDIIGPLTIAALFANNMKTIIFGLEHTKIKECNRPETLCRELTKIGATISEKGNSLIIEPLTNNQNIKKPKHIPLPSNSPLLLDPEEDHRMAMAFGLLSLKMKKIEIKDKGCVSKSFPAFWEELDKFNRY